MSPEPLVGRVLAGRYEILRRLGSGGMGVVYEAVELDLGRRVAVKVLALQDRRALERLSTEALAVAAASHPNVVQLLGAHTEHDPPFLVMELLRGRTLAEASAQDGPMNAARAVRIAVQILAALETAHTAGILHRDVKPANVMLVDVPGAFELVKVLDFGLAKLDGGASHTTTGTALGTLRFMAPEQLRGRAIDARTDLHAVGVCLFQMLTARGPFVGADDNVVAAILHEVPPPVTASREDVPAALADVVARALEKEPARRFASASEMAAALRRAIATAAALAPTTGPARASARRGGRSSSARVFLVAAGAALVVGALVVGGLFLAARSSGASRPRPTSTAAVAPPIASEPPPAPPPAPSSAAESAPAPTPAPRDPRPSPLASARRVAPAVSSAPFAPPPLDAGPRVPATRVVFGAPSYHEAVLSPEELTAFRASAVAISACTASFPEAFASGDQIQATKHRDGDDPTLLLSYYQRGGLAPLDARRCVKDAVDNVRVTSKKRFYVVYDFR